MSKIWEHSNSRPVLWLTGLSGAGKSTIADELHRQLAELKIRSVRLDGDALRSGLNSDLGFSKQDRSENLRRSAHVARLINRLDFPVICSFITPLNEDRQKVREIIGESFVEVFVSASLEVCEKRDPKGLYERARAGSLKEFTGVSSSFETPVNPEIVLDTEKNSVEESLKLLWPIFLKD